MGPKTTRAQLAEERVGGVPADTFRSRCWRTRNFEFVTSHEFGELLQTEFAEAKLLPLIDRYGDTLREEVELRASATGQASARSRQEFESNLASLKELVTKRREWLLAQNELRDATLPPQR
jgi:CotH kinase protein